jgi:hypothetical protein
MSGQRSTAFALWTVPAAAVMVLLSGCTSGDTSDGAAATTSPEPTGIELPRTGACGDAFFWAESTDGHVAVTVDAVYSKPPGSDPAMTIPFTVPGPVVDVRVLTGNDLSQNFCTDILLSESEPTTRLQAVEGHGEITIDPPQGEEHASGHMFGTLELRDLVAEDGQTFSTINVSSNDLGGTDG